MRKFLLLSAALLGMTFANAATVTWVASEQGYGNGQEITSISIGDVNVSLSNGENSNGPKYFNTGSSLRVYGGNTMTFSCTANINSVVLTTAEGNAVNAASTVSAGELAIDGTIATWTGPAPSFTFTQGGTTGHARIQSITVDYEEGAKPVYTAQGQTLTFNGWACNPLYGELVKVQVFEDYINVVNTPFGDLKVVADKTTQEISKLYVTVNGVEQEIDENNPYVYGNFGPYYCARIYLDKTYAYAGEYGEADGGYIAISMYYYTENYDANDDSTYLWGSYAIEWPYVEPMYTTTAVGVQYDGDPCPIVGKEYKVDAFEDHVRCYVPMYNSEVNAIMDVYFDAAQTVVGMAYNSTTEAWSYFPEGDGDWANWIYSNLGDYYCMSPWVGYYTYNDYAYAYSYANADATQYEGGYVALTVSFYLDDYVDGTFSIQWGATEIESLSALKDLKSGTDVNMNVELTVVYANGSNVYVTDGTDYSMIYKSGTGLAAGDVIAPDWYANYTLYYGTPEIVPVGDLTVVDKVEVPAPMAAKAADVTVDNVNAYIRLSSVTFAEATPSTKSNFTGAIGDAQIAFYNSYKIESVEAGTYDVIGIVGQYNGAPQVYPIAYAEPSNAINSVGVDAAEAVYYNLQGVKVANPKAGNAYIRVLNGKAAKVVK